MKILRKKIPKETKKKNCILFNKEDLLQLSLNVNRSKKLNALLISITSRENNSLGFAFNKEIMSRRLIKRSDFGIEFKGLNQNDAVEGEVLLNKIVIDMESFDDVVHSKIFHKYYNRTNMPGIATFLFPIHENFIVSGITVHSGSKTFKAKVLEVRDPKEIAGDSQDERIIECTMHKERDVYRVHVGIMEENAIVMIEVDCISTLKRRYLRDDVKELSIVFPASILPKYGQVKNGESNLDPGAPCSLQLTGRFHTLCTLGADIAFCSPSHPEIEVERITNTQFQIKLSTEVDKDIQLNWQVKESAHPLAVIHSNFIKASIPLPLAPNYLKINAQTEYIFLIDRSRSMLGRRLNQAKRALQIFLHSLPLECQFNIIGFGSSYEYMWNKSKRYDAESLAEAIAYVNIKVQANLGGTDLENVLQFLYQSVSETAKFKNVFLVTDGSVDNPEHCLRLAERHFVAQNIRVFTLGIGTTVSRYLVNTLAEITNAISECITSDSEITQKIVFLLEKSFVPHYNDISIQFQPNFNALNHSKIQIQPSFQSGHNKEIFIIFDNMPRINHFDFIPIVIDSSSFPSTIIDLPVHKLPTSNKNLIEMNYVTELIKKYKIENNPLAETQLAIQHQLLTENTTFIIVEESLIRSNLEDIPIKYVNTNCKLPLDYDPMELQKKFEVIISFFK